MTRREYDPWIRRLYQNRGKLKLSSSALETLAIIAYKKTVTRADIESIRGVNSDATLKTLLEKSLVEVTDRQDGPGRPLIYGTTRYFLEYFGLNSLEDLPDLKELEEIFNSTEQQNFVRENQT
jgi:segregation and condensation protein B